MQKTLLKYVMTACMLLPLYGQSHAAAIRFEVSNNLLIDHKLGLEWQNLVVNESGLPDDLQIGGWRVATFSEVVDVFPVSFSGEASTILRSSDIYAALELFSSTAPETDYCVSFSSDATCFTGYSYDNFQNAYSPSWLSFQSSHNEVGDVIYYGATTASAYYSNDWCAATKINCAKLPIFTVRAIPEPNTLSLLILGLSCILFVVRRKKWGQHLIFGILRDNFWRRKKQ